MNTKKYKYNALLFCEKYNLKKMCESCGYKPKKNLIINKHNPPLHLHHLARQILIIIENPIIENPFNIAVLCPKCHYKTFKKEAKRKDKPFNKQLKKKIYLLRKNNPLTLADGIIFGRKLIMPFKEFKKKKR